MVIEDSTEIASCDEKNADIITLIPLLNKPIQTEKNAGNKHENMDSAHNSSRALETDIGTAKEEEGIEKRYATEKVMAKGRERSTPRDRRQICKALEDNGINGTTKRTQKNSVGEDKEYKVNHEKRKEEGTEFDAREATSTFRKPSKRKC